VNTTPQPPSSHARGVPAMLDLIVAKAMAKLLEDRYQSVKEFGDDLREVRRQMDSSRPAAALKAVTAPPSSRPAEKLVDTATIPMEAGGGKRGEEEAQPLSLAKTFDSFDATLRLAAMTDQTEDFREYISETQKMRAYRGKIEPGSPLAEQLASQSKPAPAPKKKKPAPRPVEIANPSLGNGAAVSSTSTNLIAIGAIIVLAFAAIGLIVALLMK
jgi:hypothetical protein